MPLETRNDDNQSVTSQVHYTLQSAISHIGDTILSGHYITHVKQGNKWYSCSDTNVKECATGINETLVTVLAYKRCQHSTSHFLPEITVPLQGEIPGPSNKIHVSSHLQTDGHFLQQTQYSINSPSEPNMPQKISLHHGDITDLDVDCIVNAANSTLLGGGGVDGRIHKVAGPQLKQFCVRIGYCAVGDAVITPGFKLKSRSVIHTVGPQDGDSLMLAKCYHKSLSIASDPTHNIKTIAFPCIATGAYSINQLGDNDWNDQAARIALSTVRDWLKGNSTLIDRIIFCTYEAEDQKCYKNLVAEYFPYFVSQ